MSAPRKTFVVLLKPCRDCGEAGCDATEQSAARTLCRGCYNERMAARSSAYRARRDAKREQSSAVTQMWRRLLTA